MLGIANRVAHEAPSYFENGHKNVADSNQIWYRGNEALSDYAFYLDPPMRNGWGTMNRQIRHRLKIPLVTHYQTECTKSNIGSPRTCLNVDFAGDGDFLG